MHRDPTQSDTRMGRISTEACEKSPSIVTVHKLKNTSSNHSKDDYQSNVSRSNGALEYDMNIMGKFL